MEDEENQLKATEEEVVEEEDQPEEKNEDTGEEKQEEEPKPGFSFSKSAIADLPSTAVQSIKILENEGPVEVDDDVFVWHDTKSGTKLKAKIKKKDKHKTASHTPRSSIKIAMPPPKQKKKKTGAKFSGAQMRGKKITSKSRVKKQSSMVSKTVSKGHYKKKTPSSNAATPIESKDRVKERRSSQIKSAAKSSLTKAKSKARSKTKMSHSREKKSSQEHF